VTMQPITQCFSCARWTGDGTTTCTAFPKDIPDEIWFNRFDHRKPYKGDHGLQWESNGIPFPPAGAMNLPGEEE
jgi:hypothetical protein